MIYGILAKVIVVLHLAFVIFVVLGGFLVVRWPRLAWFHIPALLWGAVAEIAGLPCPLTPLEIWLLLQAGEVGYAGGFVEHYLLGWLYPEALTRVVQVFMGVAVLVLNAGVYYWVWRRSRLIK